MNVSMQKLVNAVNTYIERDAIKTGATIKKRSEQFAFGFKLGIAKECAKNLISYALNDERIKVLGIVNEEDLINLDIVYNAAKFSIENISDKQIEFFGLKLDESDLDKLYNYARG